MIESGAREGRASQSRLFWTIAFCFLLSGFAALLYETVWLRQFAIILGTSEQALAVILGAYMGGLSFGAWIASRTTGWIRRPLLTYGVLEAAIALCALAMPVGLFAVQSLQASIFGGSAEPPEAGSPAMIIFGLASAFALILPPTAMMGATLPLLAKYVVYNDEHLGQRIGLLYAINTLGAVAGTLCAAFIFMPTLGLAHTTWVGAFINFAIFGLIWFGLKEAIGADTKFTEHGIGYAESESAASLDKSQPGIELHGEKQAGNQAATSNKVSISDGKAPPPYRSILWFAAFSGAISFGYEIVFTRMLGHTMGGSIFAFATMLAGFLLGIALGGAIASRLATSRDNAAKYFVYSQAFTGILALAAFWSINIISGWSFEDASGSQKTFAQVAIAIAILLPSATCIGATFPLAIRIYAKDERDAATGSAKVYLWNTLGAIFGSLLMGMFLLPNLAYHGAIILAISLNAALAIVLVWVMRVPHWHALAGVATLVCLLIQIPVAPEDVLRASALPGPNTHGPFIFNRVGQSATVCVFEQEGAFRFQTNGLPESIVQPRGAGLPYRSDGAWLAALPPLVRPGGDTMLIIGLGGGVAASFVPPSVDHVDVFELESAVVDANRSISDVRRRDPLSDQRVRIVLNDGRNGLSLTTKKYDYIVSQPSHPWTAGASHLYTKEFNAIAKQHLQPGGVFLQWMDAQFVDLELVRSMLAGLFEAFPHVRVYEPRSGSLMFVASDEVIAPENIPDQELTIEPEDVSFYRDFGMLKPTDLLVALKMDEPTARKLSENAKLITDEFNLLAMRSPRLVSAGIERENAFKDSLKKWEPIHVYPDGLEHLCPTINYRSFLLRIRGRRTDNIDPAGKLIHDPAESALLASTLAQYRGNSSLWKSELLRAADLDPNDPRAACLILCNEEMGLLPKIDEFEKEELAKRLDDRFGAIYQSTKLMSLPNNEGVAEIAKLDDVLASFKPDDVGYVFASRLRLVWRISDQGPDSVRIGNEALEIASEASPSLGPESIAFFQMIAAMKADRPEIALATAMSYAKSMLEMFKEIDTGKTSVDQVKAMFPNLQRCRQVLSDPRDFHSVPTHRYRSVLLFLDNLLAGYPGE